MSWETPQPSLRPGSGRRARLLPPAQQSAKFICRPELSWAGRRTYLPTLDNPTKKVLKANLKATIRTPGVEPGAPTACAAHHVRSTRSDIPFIENLRSEVGGITVGWVEEMSHYRPPVQPTVFNIFTSPTVPINDGGAPSRLMSGSSKCNYLPSKAAARARRRLITAISSRQTRRRVRTGAKMEGSLLLSAKPSHPARADVIDVRHRRHQGDFPADTLAHPMCSYYPPYRATTAFRYPLDIATKTTISRRLRRIFLAEWRKAWVNSPHKNEITEEKDRHAAENIMHLCRIFTPQGKRELKLDVFLIVVALRTDTTTGRGPRALKKDWLEAIGQCK
ncbi:hypothetical protein C8F04DRAFT_1194687 [Mycena alexandri]|uniref:Uncharacterized protein n=1 Tax=Mycena alexandri TaxID=1745969 RepID=A0AAD6S7B6_9AGAR|nr:hypothetical protein C8F04DRAFT_1194687 [Mycena alexandri]